MAARQRPLLLAHPVYVIIQANSSCISVACDPVQLPMPTGIRLAPGTGKVESSDVDSGQEGDMPFRLDIIAAVLSFAGAFFLLKANLATSDREIKLLSSTFFDSNAFVAAYHKRQVIDTRIGFGLLGLGFSCQVVDSFIVGFTVLWLGIGMAMLLLALVAGWILSDRLTSSYNAKVEEVLKARKDEGYVD